MKLGLTEKRVLVTGSSKGIGLTIAKGFLREGAKVVLNSRKQEELDECKENLIKGNTSSQLLPIACDFTQHEDIIALKKQIIQEWNGIDIIVANVGSGKSVPDAIPEVKHWDRVFSLNFDSALYTAREFYPLLQSSKGSLIFISSITGMEALGAPTDYSVAKTAVIAFAKNLARKIASEGIRVNCIAPGNIYFEGGSWDEKIKSDPQKIKHLIKNSVPMQRFGKPEEVADAVLFLSSERASFITGTVLKIDGGQTAGMF
jgi:3-oxoacyl-[acyl-carrier protein] reductase